MKPRQIRRSGAMKHLVFLSLLSSISYVHAQTPTVEIDPLGAVPAGFTQVRAWEWNTLGDAEGWAATNATPANVTGGEVTATASTTDPRWTSATLSPAVSVPQDVIVEFKVKRASGNTSDVQVYHADFGGGLDANRSATVSGATLNDGNYHVLRVTYRGMIGARIDQLRIDPLQTNSATFGFDY